MHSHLDFLLQLQRQAQQSHHRQAVVLRGDRQWQRELVATFVALGSITRSVALASTPFPVDKQVAINKGQQLLGQECDLLLVELGCSFDANSFNAACGTLVGGGLLLLLDADDVQRGDDLSWRWLKRHLDELVVLGSGSNLSHDTHVFSNVEPGSSGDRFTQQAQAIDAIVKVVTGRRKRPLVLTADRGRGKSSALGMACARLLEQAEKPLRILVTAPSPQAVRPVFYHAARLLGDGAIGHKHALEYRQSEIVFAAPDALLAELPECDVLLVDEAAAIPTPMLEQMVRHYHRMVFSSTVHGYEGCGRGFSIKFVPWLADVRTGMTYLHLTQPIRWQERDPLESWLNRTFLLDAALPERGHASDLIGVVLEHQDKAAWLADRRVLEQCFALLVNAHYQTSPNDLFHLLSDPEIQLYAAFDQQQVVGAILTVAEGKLADDLVEVVCLGHRRPKGHLVPVTLLNQLNVLEAAASACLRVMRIAVHPKWQNVGVGRAMLRQLEAMCSPRFDYLGTSFGATQDLVCFWQQAGFTAVRVGSTRDAASGTHSVLMLRALTTESRDWVAPLTEDFALQFVDLLPTVFSQLDVGLVQRLLAAHVSAEQPAMMLSSRIQQLLQRYSQGGNSYDSMVTWLKPCVIAKPMQADAILIKLVLQHQNIRSLTQEFGLSGRKAVEQRLRHAVGELIEQCQFTL